MIDIELVIFKSFGEYTIYESLEFSDRSLELYQQSRLVVFIASIIIKLRISLEQN